MKLVSVGATLVAQSSGSAPPHSTAGAGREFGYPAKKLLPLLEPLAQADAPTLKPSTPNPGFSCGSHDSSHRHQTHWVLALALPPLSHPFPASAQDASRSAHRDSRQAVSRQEHNAQLTHRRLVQSWLVAIPGTSAQRITEDLGKTDVHGLFSLQETSRTHPTAPRGTAPA